MINRALRLSFVPDQSIEALEPRLVFAAALGGSSPPAINQIVSTIQFDLAPAAVREGLGALALSSGFRDPATNANQFIRLGNYSGLETFTLDIRGAGSKLSLTVDKNGQRFTPPVKSTTTWSALNTSQPAAAAQISRMILEMRLSPLRSGSSIQVSTDHLGQSTYTVSLKSLSTTTGRSRGAQSSSESITVSVNQAGNPVGEAMLPFSVFSDAIQIGINALAPAGQALFSNSTQLVRVRTLYSATSYTTSFTSPGRVTTVTVNAAGAPTTLPSKSGDVFFNASFNAQLGLSALASALGYVGDISATTPIYVFNEGQGQSVYTVKLPINKTMPNGRSVNYFITISVDQDGNPTVMPETGDVFTPRSARTG